GNDPGGDGPGAAGRQRPPRGPGGRGAHAAIRAGQLEGLSPGRPVPGGRATGGRGANAEPAGTRQAAVCVYKELLMTSRFLIVLPARSASKATLACAAGW